MTWVLMSPCETVHTYPELLQVCHTGAVPMQNAPSLWEQSDHQ